MVLRGHAVVAVVDLVDGGDPEAVGAERLEAQLHVVEVSRHSLPLLPSPLLLLRVLLLPRPHHELWQETDTVTGAATSCSFYFLLPVRLKEAH